MFPMTFSIRLQKARLKITQIILAAAALSGMVGCATLTNDAYMPMALSFSDGSNGKCRVTNKRMAIEVEVPGTPMVRRSDDNLILDCKVEDARTVVASVPSVVGGKIVASAVFLDFGITDAITDKHREYPASYVIPLKKKPAK